MILINLLPHREAARKRRRENFYAALGASALVGGLIAGAAASFWAMRFVRPLLYGLKPYDAITLAGTALVLALVTLAASWAPIRRATRVDPAAVLREN